MKLYKSKMFICIIACVICISSVIILRLNVKENSKNEKERTFDYSYYDDNELLTGTSFTDIMQNILKESGHDVSTVTIELVNDNELLCRQDLYAMVMQYINETDSLRNLCWPIGCSIEEGSESFYYKKLFKGQIITGNSSFQENVLANQMEQAKKMNVISYEYSSGNIMRVFAWGSPESLDRYVEFFDDFNQVKEDNMQKVLEACGLGIVKSYISETSYEILLHPDENVTVFELKEIINKILYKELRLMPDVISITSFAGDEFDYDGMSKDMSKVFLRLSNKAVIMAAREMENFMADNEQSYVGFDLNGVSFCLWFNSIKFGAIHIPLNFASEPAYLDIDANNIENNNDVLSGFSLFIPKEYRDKFISWAKLRIKNKEQDDNFDLNFINAFIATTDENTYTIFIS